MAKVRWTDEQQNAICAEGGSLLVSAAAGSGKTAALVERIVRKISDTENPCDISDILVVTFSNASAAEMRTRVKKRLFELMAEDPKNSHLKRQWLLLSKAKICTVDSFCIGLLREHFVEAQISPDFRIGGGAELDLLRNEAVSSVLQAYWDSSDENFLRLVDLISPKKNDKKIISAIFRMESFLSSHPFPKEWLAEKSSYYDADVSVCDSIFFKEIEQYSRELFSCAENVLSTCLKLCEYDDVIMTAYGGALSSDLHMVRALKNHLDNKNIDSLFNTLQTPFASLGSTRKCQEIDIKNYVKASRDNVKKLICDYRDKILTFNSAEYKEDMNDLSPLVQLFLKITEEYLDEYARLKTEKNIMDFSDSQHKVISLLLKNENGIKAKTDLAISLQKEIKEIMIDEFQDTNESQFIIFESLSNDGKNLFTVGDAKQSIYRFRMADPSIFINKKKIFSTFDGHTFPATIDFTNNFRSSEAICGFTNSVFRQIMREKTGEIDYTIHEALKPNAKYLGDESGVSLHIIERSDEIPSSLTGPIYVAREIKRMLEGEELIDKGGELKKIEPGDIAIILRKKKERTSLYRKELEKLGIKVFCESDESFFETREISSLIMLLRCIDNPYSNMNLVGAMMSPLFSFTPDEIALMKLSGERLFYNSIKALKKNSSKFEKFEQALTDLKKLSVFTPMREFLDKVYSKLDVLNIFASLENGSARKSNLLQFLSFCSDFEKSGFGGLSSFIRFIDKAMENGHQFKKSADVSAENAVHIMSIHASKGLEFPVVFLCDTEKDFSNMDFKENYLCHRELGLCTKRKHKDKPLLFSVCPYEAAKIRILKEERAEEMRLLYVALTRAKQRLILTASPRNSRGTVKKILDSFSKDNGLSDFEISKCKNFFEWTVLALASCDGAEKLYDYSGALKYTFRSKTADKQVEEQEKHKEIDFVFASLTAEGGEISETDKQAEADSETIRKIEENMGYMYPFQELSKIPVKLSVSDIAKSSSSDFSALPAFLTEQKAGGTQVGNSMHKFMQFADYEGAYKNLDAEIERMREKAFISSEELSLLKTDLLTGFFNSSTYERIRNSPRVLREYSFMHEISASEVLEGLSEENKNEKILVQGIADCIFFEDGKAIILDYKTDRVKSFEELKKRYTRQLLLYKAAIEQKLKIQVSDCIIYSFFLGGETSVLK